MRPNRAQLWLQLRLSLAAAVSFTVVAALPAVAKDTFTSTGLPLFQRLCFDCHGNGEADGRVDLQKLSSAAAFADDFKTWERVAAIVEQGKMPPADMPQPSVQERIELVTMVRDAVRRVAQQQAGDPGRVILRRLTSAEYGYTIQDLTGLDLLLEREFDSDAVGGEGFANIGDVQFVQDSTLERYLEAAKKVASHAIIGAGPIHFYRDPGKSGFELSAVNRIQDIYRAYGFRTGAGEGAEPFGLDRYPKAFYAAWRYLHRDELGLRDATLSALAAEEKLHATFVEHVWSVLTEQSPTFPVSEIVRLWRQLPAPERDDAAINLRVRAECDELYRVLQQWQSRLADTAGDEEEAPVLTDSTLLLSPTSTFTARMFWPEESKVAHVYFSVEPAIPVQTETPVILWHSPKIRFRNIDRSRTEERPLREAVRSETSTAPAFGRPRGGAVESGDFVSNGAGTFSFEIPIPMGTRGAEITVEAQLDVVHGGDCVVRCEVSHGEVPLRRRFVSAMLADPSGDAFASWKAGVLDFARKLPQVSHREPAPSDRDPIPPPFDTTYNNPERNQFHYQIKYHRDDRFLAEKLLDDAAKRRLDEAWTDLLSSFEYHDLNLQFVAHKYGLSLEGRGIAELDDAWIETLPDEPRKFVASLVTGYRSAQAEIMAAQTKHVEDELEFAERAWRRPLTEQEQQRLRSFYSELRDGKLDHVTAIRGLLVRILVAPAFLYRAELQREVSSVAPLPNWELANRLSYFLWSSPPDAELRQLAAEGKLSDAVQLAAQAKRMLRDPKARRFATEFFGQWFGFYRFDDYRGIDGQRFPEFTDSLKQSMHEEAVAFFEHIVRADRPVADILFADYAFLDRNLAAHYAIETSALADNHLGRVDMVGRHHRGGLLGLGAVLTVTSAPLRTSPVKRGDWVLRRVIGMPVPPPPADAGSIPADDALADGLTVRQRLAAHRRNATCNNCHARIDPLGFALEHYDLLGRWRDEYRDGQPIEASGTLSDGIPITGPDGLRNYLREQQRQFERNLCVKLLGYALGRNELASDRFLIDDMLLKLPSNAGRFSSLVEAIVTSRQFRYYRAGDDKLATLPGDTTDQSEVDSHVEP